MNTKKKFFLFIAIDILLFLLLFANTVSGQSDYFTVVLKGQKGTKGNVRICLADREAIFPYECSSAKIFAVNEEGKYKMPLEMSANYTIAVYQDINKNGKMDKNLVGAPTEPYGFSRNPKILFSAPNFDECKVSIDSKSTHTIQLN